MRESYRLIHLRSRAELGEDREAPNDKRGEG
jgi:hypothetical protein